MVGIGLVPGLLHRPRDAAHVGVGGPVEAGQLALVVQSVAAGVAGSFAEVDAAHVFAPADDLTNDTLC